jgi:DNA-binding NarL/FixJ family response regulator
MPDPYRNFQPPSPSAAGGGEPWLSLHHCGRPSGDHRGVCSFLEESEDVEVVGPPSGEEALRLISELLPDVAVLDIRCRSRRDRGRPASMHRRSHRRHPLHRLPRPPAFLLDALDAGAAAFSSRRRRSTTLAARDPGRRRGRHYVDPVLAGVLAGPQAADRLRALSPREREVLRLLADGMRNDAVAAHLSISTSTVRTHVKHAMEKLEADTRTQAVARALRDSLIA